MFKILGVASLALVAGCTMFLEPRAKKETRVPAALVSPILIETVSGTMCNAVRLNPTTVATAAHCLTDDMHVNVLETGTVSSVSDAFVHPAFDMAYWQQAAGYDLAKLSVAAPSVFKGQVPIRPIAVGPADILVKTRSGELEQIPCDYLGRSGAIVELSCSVSLGWSGAPVVQNGALVGILSARGQSQSTGIVQIADATRLDSF